MGFTLQEVKENQKYLSHNSFCVYKTADMNKPEFIPVAEVLCLANLGSQGYSKMIFSENKPSDSYIDDMLRRGVVSEEDGKISVSDKANNATYIFFCQIPESRR